MARRTTAALFGALGALLTGGMALAHTPYLLPNTFDPERDHVTLEGALTEDDYFRPDIGLKAPSYVETTPTGEERQVAPAIVLKDVAVVQADLPEPGTYRFSTAGFVSRQMQMAEVGGRWAMVRPAGAPDHHGPDHADHASGSDAARPQHKDGDGPPAISAADVPPGARTIQVRNVLTAETYVSKGAPTDAALKPRDQGFELKPITHPNAIYVDQGFAFRFLIDGAPAANVPVSVYREGDVYDDRKITAELRTDAHGDGKVSFERPGVYLLTAHYPAGERAPGAAPAATAYAYSLTFEVTR